MSTRETSKAELLALNEMLSIASRPDRPMPPPSHDLRQETTEPYLSMVEEFDAEQRALAEQSRYYGREVLDLDLQVLKLDKQLNEGTAGSMARGVLNLLSIESLFYFKQLLREARRREAERQDLARQYAYEARQARLRRERLAHEAQGGLSYPEEGGGLTLLCFHCLQPWSQAHTCST